MRIRDVEILTGLSRKTIRFYEAKGLLSVDRSDNSYREYDEGVVEQLKLIALLRRAGISLADIQLWQDGVITSGEMLNKRLTELRSEANIALDQVRLCNQLLAGELQDLMSDTRTNSEDDPELDESSDGSGELCLGLDIGTTTISAVVLSPTEGRAAGVYTIANASDLPADHVWEKMQDPEIITGRVEKLLESLLHRYPGIKSVGITGQMHGILYINREGNALSPLYTWQDERAGMGNPSPCTVLLERTGYNVSPGYGLATHFALMQSGEVPDGAVKICTIMDYAVMKLTGNPSPVLHTSNAASLGFWVTADSAFDSEAIRRAGMDPDILPPVTASGIQRGTWNGIPVTLAIGDNQASFLGSVKDPAHAALANFGTGSQVSLLCRNPDEIRTDAAMELRPFLEDTWLASGSALCGGRAYALMERFFRQYVTACGIAPSEQYEIMNKLAEKGLESGKVLPVRTTFCGTRNDPGLRGSITGISEDLLTPDAMIAGVLWGMSDELHEMFLKMPHSHVDTLILSGNAVRKNPALRKTLKQVFGMDACLPVHREEAAFGAAMFSAIASGYDKDAVRSCIRYSGIE